MRIAAMLAGLGYVCAALTAAHAAALQADAPVEPESPHDPAAVSRSALGRVEFLAGDWEGEGWALTRSGERQRFWVRELYRYRGDRDLLDMEGRFGDILPDGTRTEETEYDLGILYWDAAAGEYRMWHYSSTGEVMSVTMNVDLATREMHYTKELSGGRVGRFHLVVGADEVWVSRFDILQPDASWKQVMEFRMERMKRRAPASTP